MKKVFKYLKDTKGYGIQYGGPYGDEEVRFHSDADRASSRDRKSIIFKEGLSRCGREELTTKMGALAG